MKKNRRLNVRPLITERSFDKAKSGWYTFAVSPGLRKNQAAGKIEEVFGVKVVDVKSARIKGKKKRSLKTRRLSKGQDYKKIIVKLAKDQKIDLFESGGK